MFVRSAYFEGDVADEDKAAFDAGYRDVVGPTMATFPNVRHVRLLWGRDFEDDDRKFYLVVEHGYDEQAHVAIALASPERAALQPTLDAVMPLFKGKIYHVNSEATLLTPSPATGGRR